MSITGERIEPWNLLPSSLKTLREQKEERCLSLLRISIPQKVSAEIRTLCLDQVWNIVYLTKIEATYI
jgi:hypothetical protein